jgi:hypothetical protein
MSSVKSQEDHQGIATSYDSFKPIIIRGSLKASTLSFNILFNTIITIKQNYEAHINPDLEKFKTYTSLMPRIL